MSDLEDLISARAVETKLALRLMTNKAMREVLGMFGCSDSEISFAVRSHAQKRRFEQERFQRSGTAYSR